MICSKPPYLLLYQTLGSILSMARILPLAGIYNISVSFAEPWGRTKGTSIPRGLSPLGHLMVLVRYVSRFLSVPHSQSSYLREGGGRFSFFRITLLSQIRMSRVEQSHVMLTHIWL
jgi:hypothetical protein